MFTAVGTRLPDNCTVLEVKQCENCVAMFTRRRGTSVKYCPHCIGNLLMPDKTLDNYRVLLPHTRKSDGLPHYDDSLTVPR